jgi:hypothetical protein
VFFQDLTGHRQLRLDYHLIHETQTIDYHWNQQRTYATFGVSNHQPASLAAEHLYRFAKYFKWMGRTFLILGVAIDAVSIVRSTTPLRRAAQTTAAWALGWAGCKVVGAGGAAAGGLASPVGMAVGGLVGCVIGGAAGYKTGEWAGGIVYDWANATFIPLQRVPAP